MGNDRHNLPSRFFGISFASGLIFLLSGIVYAIGAATRAGVPGMIFDAIRAQFGFSASEVSGIANAGVFGCLIFIAFSGALIDGFGWRKLLPIGIALQVFGEYWIYASSDIWAIYLGAFLNGGGRTIGYLTLLKLLDSEFDRKYFSVLIGFFYVFSYSGTLLGTAPFIHAAKFVSWQRILELCNGVTLFCGLAIVFILMARKSVFVGMQKRTGYEKPILTKRSSQRHFWQSLKNTKTFAAIYTASCGIAVYWTLLVFAGKYLVDVCDASSKILGVMNAIVMVEMVFGGTLSFFCGNRRKIFQLSGAILILCACVLLLLGIWVPATYSTIFAYAGFLALGVGYGMTCVNIIAVREYVPPRFSASAIGLTNFCGNIVMIVVTQFGGFLFDRFSVGVTLKGAPEAFGGILALLTLLALGGVFAASCLRERSEIRDLSA